MSTNSEPLKSAEHSLVANTLLDAKCFDEAGLKANHFSDPRLRDTWQAIADLSTSGREVEVLSVAEQLGDKLDRVGGLPFLSGLLVDYRDFSPAAHTAGIIREHWTRRQIKNIHDTIDRNLTHGSADTLAAIRRELDTLESDNGRDLPTLAETHERESSKILVDLAALDSGKQIHFGLPTGLGIERVVPGGIPIGKVTALYGESGNFKTTIKNNFVWGIANSGAGKVLDFSFEDDDELTTQRFIGYHSGVSYGKIATRQLDSGQRRKVTNLDKKALDIASRVYMGGEVPPNIDEIIRLSRYYSRSRGVRCVVLDYIQLISTAKDDLDRAMRMLQLSAKRDKLSYIIVSQVKQDVDFRASKGEDARPRITDMLGSSSFRTAPKLSLGVYRPFKYHKTPAKSRRGNIPNYRALVDQHPKGADIYRELLELWVGKNVLGEPDVCLPVRVHLQTGRVHQLSKQVLDLLGAPVDK